MKTVGRILEIWRYPVSSVGGERLVTANIGIGGVAGDRQFGLIDQISGAPAEPEKHARWRSALKLQALTVDGQLPDIIFPDGQRCSVSDVHLNALLSDYFGFAVAIAAHLPIEGFRRIPYRHEHFAVHLITTSSLRRIAELRKVDKVDVRRFRPTVLVETDDAACFLEKRWTGKELSLDSVELLVREETTRCGMTFISQPGIEDDPEILRTILRSNKRHLGVNCTVHVAGTFRVGGDVTINS